MRAVVALQPGSRARPARRGRGGWSARRAAAASAGHISARASCSRMRQPPEKLLTGASSWSTAKAQAQQQRLRARRARRSRRPRRSRWCASAIAWPSPSASAAISAACASIRRVSPCSTKSVARVVGLGHVLRDLGRRASAAASSTSPASACSRLVSSANSDDLPAPLRPTRPTFSPGCSVTLVRSSTTLTPRRSVTSRSVIIERFVAALSSASRRDQQHLRRRRRWSRSQADLEASETRARSARARGRSRAPARRAACMCAARVAQHAAHEVHAVVAAGQRQRRLGAELGGQRGHADCALT